ncbi:MAG: hypothetical protein HY904_11755 [Deltaproteobacteria bacterium]|nr:hypothetical protein [Deltaproteobacteria bacterium]
MAKKKGNYDLAMMDFLPYGPMHKVEREKDKPYLMETFLAFLGKKGLVKEEGDRTLISVGKGWQVTTRVGTRAGRYIEPVAAPAKD